MQEVKIGCLHPSSGIYRGMGNDFEKGLKTGLTRYPHLIDQFKFSFFPEYVNQGTYSAIADQCEKLKHFHDVDLITGIVNMHVIELLLDNINTLKLPIIFNNLGEYIPKENIHSKFLFGNSLNLWQSQWSMGKWAYENFGDNISIYSSIYDSGYLLHHTFSQGAMAAGAEEITMNILKLQSGIVDTSSIINKITEQIPGHAHVILCGVDAKDFFKRFAKTGLANKTNLTVSPFMVEEGIMEDIEHLIPPSLNALTWSRALSTPGNNNFQERYTNEHGSSPNAFNLLGYETGLGIADALSMIDAKKTNTSLLIDALSKATIKGPRGEHKFGFFNQDFPVYIRKPQTTENNDYENQIISKTTSIQASDKKMTQSATNNISGWQNPYLCI